MGNCMESAIRLLLNECANWVQFERLSALLFAQLHNLLFALGFARAGTLAGTFYTLLAVLLSS